MTGALHTLALVISFVGILLQIHSVKTDQPFSIWLPLALSIALLLRLPNQICVSLDNKHGWFSTIGSLLAITGYVYLVITTHNKSLESQAAIQ